MEQSPEAGTSGSRDALSAIDAIAWDLPVFGLTGSIASGKSELARILSGLGAAVVDADRLGHELLEPGREGHRWVVERFGSCVTRPDGSIDRGELGRVVFDDVRARRDLEAVLHPAILERARRRVSRIAGEDVPFALLEAALLMESGMDRFVADTVVVVASRRVQLDRLVGRRGMSREQATARIDAQWPSSRKAMRARWVVRNDGTLDELERAGRRLMARIERHPAVVAARRFE
jgi:dephospho-CoA kinase